jgi:hypothetical protein
VFDIDLSRMGWNEAARTDKLAQFLRGAPGARLENRRPRYRLDRALVPAASESLSRYSHAMTIRKSRPGCASRHGSAAHRRRHPFPSSLQHRAAAGRVVDQRSRCGGTARLRFDAISETRSRALPRLPRAYAMQRESLPACAACHAIRRNAAQHKPPSRSSRLQRRADALRHFAVMLDHAAEIAAETVLVELLAGLRVPSRHRPA